MVMNICGKARVYQALFLVLVLLNPAVHASLDNNHVVKKMVGSLEDVPPMVETDNRNQLRSHDEHKVADKKIADLHQQADSKFSIDATHRQLPGYFEDLNIQESFDQLFSTPIGQWEARQWMLAALVAFTVLYCCGCIAGNRRYRRQGYYPGYGSGYGGGGYGGGRSSGGTGFCGCLRNILLCFCCYELFCGDCAHVPCFRHSSFSQESNAVGKDEEDVYHRQEGEIV
jgi:hypothetical protein